MSEMQATGPGMRADGGSLPGRIGAFLYGMACYAVFFANFLYAVGFVEGLVVPKAIDDGPTVPAVAAVAIDLLLLALFAVQHSVMARPRFKRWWTQWVAKPVERSTYVLLSSLALALLCWQWRPLPAVVWHVDSPAVATALVGLSFLGWLIVLSSTFIINHFELFGLHQVANNLTGRMMPIPRFRAPLFYKFVRHPIYLGFVIAFWSMPTMTIGRLLFAAVTTAYIFIGILLEERDLVDLFGDDYRRYRARVSMLIPMLTVWRKSP